MGFFSPDGKNAVEERPAAVDPALNEGWCRDVSHPGAGDGTEVTASFFNQLIGNLRRLVTGLGGTADGSDTMLLGAIQNGLSGFLSKAVYDPNNVGDDAFDMGKMVEAADAKILTPAERDKLALIVIANGIDLDELQQRVIELDAAIVLKGEWDASSGVFPGGGVTEPGWSYVVTVAGTVDGVEFSVNDMLLALEANAPEDSYAGYWLKRGYSHTVTSIEGQTGPLSLADIGAVAKAGDAMGGPLALAGNSTAPTQALYDDSQKIANTKFVQREVRDLIERLVHFKESGEVETDAAFLDIELPLLDYEHVEIELSEFRPVTDQVNLLFQFHDFISGLVTDPNYDSSLTWGTGGSTFNQSNVGQTSFVISNAAGNGAREGASSIIRLFNFTSPNDPYRVIANSAYKNYNGVLVNMNSVGVYTADENASQKFRLKFSSGDIAAGSRYTIKAWND